MKRHHLLLGSRERKKLLPPEGGGADSICVFVTCCFAAKADSAVQVCIFTPRTRPTLGYALGVLCALLWLAPCFAHALLSALRSGLRCAAQHALHNDVQQFGMLYKVRCFARSDTLQGACPSDTLQGAFLGRLELCTSGIRAFISTARQGCIQTPTPLPC